MSATKNHQRLVAAFDLTRTDFGVLPSYCLSSFGDIESAITIFKACTRINNLLCPSITDGPSVKLTFYFYFLGIYGWIRLLCSCPNAWLAFIITVLAHTSVGEAFGDGRLHTIELQANVTVPQHA